MKQYKCLITLFAAALFMGACSDDDNDYGTEGIAIETPAITDETSTSSASLVWQSTCAMMYAIVVPALLQLAIVSYHP